MKKINSMSIIAPLILFVLIYFGLEILVRVFQIPRTIMPTPTAILTNTTVNFVADIWPQFLVTLKTIVIGFIAAIPIGMIVAAIFSQFDILVKAITPLLILLVVTPMITLIPLFLLWLGFNENIRIIVVIVQCVPIIALNTLSGFTNVERNKLELMRSIGATRLQTFIKVILPNAMPQVFTGIKLGCIFATIGAISADIVAGNVGLGFRIMQYSGFVMIEMAYGVIIVVALIGITLFQIVSVIEKRVVIWKK